LEQEQGLKEGEIPGKSTRVELNGGKPNEGFPANSISTSKYNPVTFLPIFLFEMFSRVAYLYFLIQASVCLTDLQGRFCGKAMAPGHLFVCPPAMSTTPPRRAGARPAAPHTGLGVCPSEQHQRLQRHGVHAWRRPRVACLQAVLSWISIISPFSGFGSTFALVFVLLVAAVKAIWEDFKRHQEDRATNSDTTHVLQEDGAAPGVASTGRRQTGAHRASACCWVQWEDCTMEAQRALSESVECPAGQRVAVSVSGATCQRVRQRALSESVECPAGQRRGRFLGLRVEGFVIMVSSLGLPRAPGWTAALSRHGRPPWLPLLQGGDRTFMQTRHFRPSAGMISGPLQG
jgi:Phospholipid-translocating ATPase N-terminal